MVFKQRKFWFISVAAIALAACIFLILKLFLLSADESYKDIAVSFKVDSVTKVDLSANPLLNLSKLNEVVPAPEAGSDAKLTVDENDIISGTVSIRNTGGEVARINQSCTRLFFNNIPLDLPSLDKCASNNNNLTTINAGETKSFPAKIVMDYFNGKYRDYQDSASYDYGKNPTYLLFDPKEAHWQTQIYKGETALGLTVTLKEASSAPVNIVFNNEVPSREPGKDLAYYQSVSNLKNSPIPGPYVGKSLGGTVDNSVNRSTDYSSEIPIVGTHYYYWYDKGYGIHFDELGVKPYADFDPLLNKVSWKNVSWHKSQLADMASAGIDMVNVTYFGNSYLKGLKGSKTNFALNGLPPLIAASDQLSKEGVNPPKIAMFYDTSSLHLKDLSVDVATDWGKEWFYESIRDFYSMVPPAQRATLDGKPIIFLYWVAPAKNGVGNTALIPYVKERFRQDFGLTPYIVQEESWLMPNADSTYAWGAALNNFKAFGVASIGPGYDDSFISGRNVKIRPRENGDYYKKNWEQLLAMDPKTRPKIVVLETWNEYNEATNIARGIKLEKVSGTDIKQEDLGSKYIEITNEYAKKWKQGERVELKGAGSYGSSKGVMIDFDNTTTEESGWSKGIGLSREVNLGKFEFINLGQWHGKAYLQTVPASSNVDRQFLYFRVDDGWYFNRKDRVKIVVEYLDEGTDSFYLQYDSMDPSAKWWGAYKYAKQNTGSQEVKRVNSKTWKKAEFYITDARFANQQEDWADFRLMVLNNKSGALKIRRINISNAPLKE